MQAKAKPTRFFTEEDFRDNHETAVYWLGSAGVMVNCHGTVLLFDPVLAYKGTDPMVSETFETLLVPTPIQPQDVPHCEAVFYTHMDYDHFSERTIQALKFATKADFYVPSERVQSWMQFFGMPPGRRNIIRSGEKIQAGNITVERVAASHAWQMNFPDYYDWHYEREDCTGYRITTPDGIIWVTGDTQLLPEHFAMTDVDVMFLDFSCSGSHMGRENAVKLTNTLTRTDVIMYHYGTFDVPDSPDFSADPEDVRMRIIPPGRFFDLAPGEKYVLRKNK